MKLSYIIPFYNGQDTIHHCLDSILAIGLNLNEVEIIIVDDCSPVSAESILSDYLVKYRNIRIIQHSVNKRQGGAKNTGISLAKGKYIAFADQDDTIIANNSKLALDFALKHDVDMLACHYTILHEDKNIREYGIDKGDKQIISGKEFCEQYFATGYNLAPWANLYKRNFLQKVSRPYEENVVMEDADWIAWHWIHANKVGILNIPIYTWVMNPTSITHSQHYINRADWIKYGYRKIRDAHSYKSKSSKFSEIMENDGRQNIIGGMKKIWKVDNYFKFYQHLARSCDAYIHTYIPLRELQKMQWSGIVKLLIQYPILSCICLYPIGSILKLINYARLQCK